MSLADMARKINEADRRRAGAPSLPEGCPARLTEAERHRLALAILAGRATAAQYRMLSPDQLKQLAALNALRVNPERFKALKRAALAAEEKERRLKAEKKAAPAPDDSEDEPDDDEDDDKARPIAPRPEIKASPPTAPAPRPAAGNVPKPPVPKPKAPTKPPKSIQAPGLVRYVTVGADGSLVDIAPPSYGFRFNL